MVKIQQSSLLINEFEALEYPLSYSIIRSGGIFPPYLEQEEERKEQHGKIG